MGSHYDGDAPIPFGEGISKVLTMTSDGGLTSSDRFRSYFDIPRKFRRQDGHYSWDFCFKCGDWMEARNMQWIWFSQPDGPNAGKIWGGWHWCRECYEKAEKSERLDAILERLEVER